MDTPCFQEGLKIYDTCGRGKVWVTDLTLTFGAVLGTVELVGCLKVENYDELNECAYLDNGSEWIIIDGNEYFYGNYEPGRFAWILKNPRIFSKPISARGQQGFWNWEPEAGLQYADGKK